MSDIDRALRTLSRLQSAAPARAAERINEVRTLLMRLAADNEYLNARLMETSDMRGGDGAVGLPMPITARGALEKPPVLSDSSLEEMFGVDRAADMELFADLDLMLATTEVTAAEIEAEAAQSQSQPQGSSLDIYDDLESLLREHGISDLQSDVIRQVELTDEERSALEQRFGSEGTLPYDLPTPEELLTQLNDLMKPALLTVRSELAAMVDGRLGRLSSNQADTLRALSGTAEGMLALLDSLVLIDQLRSQSLPLQPARLDPQELVEAACRAVRDDAERHEHQIDVHIEQPIPPVQADFNHTLRILVDILDNAIRYTPDDSTIHLSAESTGASVLFTVADTGVGFTTEDSEFVGTPFWRALHEPLVRNHQGTGLRLFLAKQVLALQGGEMFFSAEPAFGSSFSFTLPTAQ